MLFQSLLFNPTKPFSRGQNYLYQDMDLMIDCFVSCFRIKPHNNEALKVCLNLSSPTTYHFVLVRSLYRFVSLCKTNIIYLFKSFQNRNTTKIALVAAN